MSYLAPGPSLLGIDSKANAGGRRRRGDGTSPGGAEAAE
jgi:hypothetical protein